MTHRAPNRLRAIRHHKPDRINAFVHAVLGVFAGVVLLLVVIVGLLMAAPMLSK